MKQIPLRNIILLLITALIWGIAFVAQQIGMDFVGPFTFTAVRCMMGVLVLIPAVYLINRMKTVEQKAHVEQRTTWIGGLTCGLLLCVATNLQQIGIQYTTAGKAGFITALYIVIVPLLGLFLKRHAGIKLWVSVLIASLGLYLLCMTGSLRLELGDSLVFLCALIFSVHIMVIDHFNPRVDGVKMSCIQFFVASILSAVGMLMWESFPTWEMLYAARIPLLYTGILSCGVAYTFQIVGQKNVNPTVASLILSLEAVISVLAAWLILHQGMTNREILGASLMFVAIILAQLPERARQKGEVRHLLTEAE